MSDWWNGGPAAQGERETWQTRAHADMERIAASGEDLSEEPDEWGYDGEGNVVDLRPPVQTPEEPKPDRRRGIILGAAGAAVAGAVLIAVMPHGGSTPSARPTTSVAAPQGSQLPAAGGAVPTSSASTAPKVVTMTTTPDGSGRVGAVVKVTIHNGTDEAITVMATMMKGDDRPAVLGEGTLAPGARAVQPGETVTGTVEFATKRPPAQIVLFDIGGNVVAAS